MRTASALFRSILVLLAVMVTSATVKAEVPGRPVEFGARVMDRDLNGPVVKLSWFENRDAADPTGFNIYMAAGETEDETLFTQIGTVEVTPNTPLGNYVFTYIVENLDPGTYTFFIKAFNADGEGQRSVIRVVVLEDPSSPDIDIKSQPPSTGVVGKAYSYQAKLYKNFDGGTATWEIVFGPDGMTISDGGLVTWPEPKAGRYEVKIKVSVEFNGAVLVEDQSWVIEITEGPDQTDKCVTIVGSVKFEDANAVVMNGWVIAWRIQSVTNDNGEIEEKSMPISKAEIRQGTYELKVPAGSYKIRIEGEGFHAEWYQDAAELADAETIVVTCDEPRVEINFVVTGRPEPEKFVVTGRVYDAETNEGFKNALVIFEPRKHDNPNAGIQLTVFKAETNEEGYYRIELPQGLFFIASAVVRDGGTVLTNYLREWWENTHDATQATVIEITGNIDGISFPMHKHESYNNGFGGSLVDDESGDGVPGKVTAYMLNNPGNSANDHGKINVATVETDDNGIYKFTDLIPGDYIIFGVPSVRPYVPGWYVTGGTASHSWKEATIVSVGDVMITVEHTIRLEKVKDGIGRGRVRGWVFDRRGGIISKDDLEVENSDGIMGSLVVATDATGNVIDFAISENAGSYELLQMGVGTWSVLADRVGFEPISESVTLDDNNLDVSLSIGLVKSVTSVDVPTNLVGSVYNLYPNPTNASATLEFPSTPGSAQVSVISTTGVVLSVQNVDVTGSRTILDLNTSNIPMGMVLVRVTNGARTFALPLQIVR